MRPRFLLRSSLLLLGLAAVFPAARATTLVPTSEAEMIQRADAIVLGRCVDARSAWVGRQLVTRYTIATREVLKGAPQSSYTVVVPGGIDASRRVPVAMTYPGAPRFLLQEEVLLFLDGSRGKARGGHGVVGFSQGKYAVFQDDQGRFLAAPGMAPPSPARAAAGAVTLDELRERIRRELDTPRAPERR